MSSADRPVRVIVADSDPLTVELITVVLTRRGFAVQATLEGLDALSRFLDTAPDLVICDQVLSGVSARELCKRIKESRADARVALLVPTAIDAKLQAELLAQTGCDGVLARPFHFRDFAELLAAWGLRPPEDAPAVDPASFVVPKSDLLVRLEAVAPPEGLASADASDAALAELPPMPMLLPAPIPLDAQASAAELRDTFHLTAAGAGIDPARRPRPATASVAKAPTTRGEARRPTPSAAAPITPHDATAGLPPSIPAAGKLEQVPLPRLIFELYANTFTGVLQLVRGGVRRSVNFVGGLPVRVDSRQLNENLGRMLVEHGRITQAQYDAAQDLIDREGMRQGQALVTVGAISEADLSDALREQTERKLVNTLAWRDGDYTLVPDNAQAEREVFGELNPFRALWRGVREHYDAAGLQAFFLPLGAHYILGNPALAAHHANVGALLRDAGVPQLLDGKTTFGQAVAAEEPKRVERLVGLYVLLVTDLIRPSETPGEPTSIPETPTSGVPVARRSDAAPEEAPPSASAAKALDAEREYQAGAEARERGDLLAARDCFLRAVQLDLAEPAYRVALADAVWRLDPMGDTSRRYALGVLEQALQLDPGSVDANLLAARIFRDLGDHARARELAAKVLQRQPEHPEARAIVGG